MSLSGRKYCRCMYRTKMRSGCSWNSADLRSLHAFSPQEILDTRKFRRKKILNEMKITTMVTIILIYCIVFALESRKHQLFYNS